MQTVLVILLFLVAVGYLSYLLYQQFRGSSTDCPKGCGSCSAIDLESIQKKIEQQVEEPIT
jgi:hypothetical protein